LIDALDRGNLRRTMDACSFCGRKAEEVGRLIASGGDGSQGAACAICNDCVELCYRIVHGPHTPLPPIPQDILARAGVCPTEVTNERGTVVVNCACAAEPSEAQATACKELLAPYFPAGAKFRYFWPVEPPARASATEWLETQIAVYNEPPSTRFP
jgi:hypothetical protein